MTGREFIKTVLIDGIGIVANQHPYFAFALMCIGVEFLGKCLHCDDIHKPYQSREDFGKAIDNYPSLTKYKDIDNLYGCLRCGLLHAFLPEDGVVLCADKNDLSNKIIGCKDFYEDFATACTNAIDSQMNISQRNLDDSILEIVKNLSGTTNEIKLLGNH